MLKGTSQNYDELACTLREKWRREKYTKGTSLEYNNGVKLVPFSFFMFLINSLKEQAKKGTSTPKK